MTGKADARMNSRLSSPGKVCQDERGMSQLLEIEVSDEVLLAMQKDPKDLAGEMRLAAAAKILKT